MLLQLRFRLGLSLGRFGFWFLVWLLVFGLALALGIAFSLGLAFGLASALGLALLLHFTLHDSFPYRFLVQNGIPSTGLSLTQPQYSLRFHVKHNPNPLPCILQWSWIRLILCLNISVVSKYPAIRYSCDELRTQQYAKKYDPMLHSIVSKLRKRYVCWIDRFRCNPCHIKNTASPCNLTFHVKHVLCL